MPAREWVLIVDLKHGNDIKDQLQSETDNSTYKE